jgi:hypothetical protein
MAGPVITTLAPTVYQVESEAGSTAVVLAFQPARTGGPCGVWMIGRSLNWPRSIGRGRRPPKETANIGASPFVPGNQPTMGST